MSLEAELAAIVGEAHVLVDRDVVASYESDWTGRFTASARCVVRPASTDEVAAVVTACREAGVQLCVQGGNTGLVGGSVPVDGAVVLSTRRLSQIEDIDPIAAQVTVGAGATLSSVQGVVRKAGFDIGVDFAARESCTVGGMTSTNAGGERVLRYGTMRAQITGVEAVMPDGTVVSRLAGLPKDNTGYDLVSLLAGAEGTLGVLTKLRLKLVPLLPGRAVALVAVGSTTDAVELVRSARSLRSLEAAELFYSDGLELVCAHTGLPAPFADKHPAYVLLECADREDPDDELLAALEAAGDVVLDATVATDARGRHALWAYRESHTESISASGVPVKLDVAVPIGELPDLVDALPGAIEAAAPGARLILFGHVNEGNLHVNILDALDHDEEVTEAVLKLVSSYGGSISAEHGVGRAKSDHLGLSRSAQEIAVMRSIKNALDPAGLPNPGLRRQPASSPTEMASKPGSRRPERWARRRCTVVSAVDVRRAADRDRTRISWLDSKHSFSFGPHYDPANTHHGLLLVNNDDIVAPGTGFETHPHRDMEIVTWVLTGSLVHQDSTGHNGLIYPGLAQRMSAGTGILHSEKNDARPITGEVSADPVHFVQMWVLPDTGGATPGYEQLEIDDDRLRGGLTPVASGMARHRDDAAIRIGNRAAALFAARLTAGESVTLPDAPYVHLFVPVGSVELEGAGALAEGDAVRLTGAGARRLTAVSAAEILVWEMHATVG